MMEREMEKVIERKKGNQETDIEIWFFVAQRITFVDDKHIWAWK
jgi:hypothetical protein